MTSAELKGEPLKRGVASWALRGFAYKMYVACVLMLSAGRWDWGMGWLYVAIFLLFDAATAAAVLPRYPSLLLERSRRPKGVKNWDKVIMPLASGLLPLAYWIVAGLNERNGWPPLVSIEWQIAAVVVTVFGHSIIVWAMAANAFFSPVVRLQTDRGQTVATGGPYKIIRHPGYVGAILFSLSVPIMLGSWWALIPGGMAAVLFVVRTALEDRTLQAELEGYREYAQRVTFRLLPGIW